MRRIDMMTASAVTLAALGALIGYAIGSAGTPSTKATHAPQPVDVRTEVIRKTVNVYRREHVAHGSGGAGGGSLPANRARGGYAPALARTRASGAHSSAPAAESAVRTRASGAAAGGGSSSTSAPVRTTASGATRPSSGSSAPVTTRSSGSGASGGGSGRPLSTRSSGGGDNEGGAHGDGGGEHGD